MSEKLATALWFAQRPSHWPHAAALAARKFLPNKDGPSSVAEATRWASERALPFDRALEQTGMSGAPPQLPPELLSEAESLAAKSKVKMGGPGDLDLLHAAVALSGAKKVVETGVAYGWSSLAVLHALHGREGAKLVSVDMPYPKMGNEAFVGVVVPERLRSPWTIVREPDRRGLEKAIALQGGSIDLCHYDSDKSWYGREYGYPLLWDALKSGGVFISDDIQDNMAFAEFVGRLALPFAVTASHNKFVGIVRKP